jgi:hypothetical protein
MLTIISYIGVLVGVLEQPQLLFSSCSKIYLILSIWIKLDFKN